MSKKSKSAHKPCLEPLSNSVLTHGALRSSSPLDFLNTRLRWLADRKKGIEKLKTEVGMEGSGRRGEGRAGWKDRRKMLMHNKREIERGRRSGTTSSGDNMQEVIRNMTRLDAEKNRIFK